MTHSVLPMRRKGCLFMTDREYIDDFCCSIREKGSSDNTVDAYHRDILRLYSFLSERNISFADADEVCMSEYKEELVGEGLSESSVDRVISSARSFYKYLVEMNITDKNPAKSIHSSKGQRKNGIDVLSNSDIEKLLSAPDYSDPKGLRDKAMLEVLYSTGLKVSEITALKLSDVNLSLGCVKTAGNGKTKKERVILLYPIAVKFLSLYIEKGRRVFASMSDSGDADGFLFLNTSGAALTRQGFWKILKHYAREAGLGDRITPISLRHSFAAHLIENGADIRDIKEVLGHVNLSSTMVYEDYIKSKIASSYLKFHPRA